MQNKQKDRNLEKNLSVTKLCEIFWKLVFDNIREI